MKVVRWILGSLILFLDWVFTPKGIKRDKDIQTNIDLETTKLALYQFAACPFCVKVRRSMKRQSLTIQTKDAKNCSESRQALEQGGGRIKVPCLKIENNDGEVSWLYESSEIIQYLESRFTPQVV